MRKEKSRAPVIAMVPSSHLDAVLLNSYQAVTYFAGSHVLSQLFLPDRIMYLLVTADDAVIVVCNIEASQVRRQSDVKMIVGYTEFVDVPEKVVAEQLTRLGLADCRVGLEMRRIPAQSRDRLMAAAPGLTLEASMIPSSSYRP